MLTARDYFDAICELNVGNPHEALYACVRDTAIHADASLRDHHASSLHKHRMRAEMRQCYYNAQRLALDTGMDYVEGWANALIPVEHAWNMENGRVIDTTWVDIYAGDYYGVVIPAPYIRMKWATGQAGPILWEYIRARLDT